MATVVELFNDDDNRANKRALCDAALIKQASGLALLAMDCLGEIVEYLAFSGIISCFRVNSHWHNLSRFPRHFRHCNLDLTNVLPFLHQKYLLSSIEGVIITAAIGRVTCRYAHHLILRHCNAGSSMYLQIFQRQNCTVFEHLTRLSIQDASSENLVQLLPLLVPHAPHLITLSVSQNDLESVSLHWPLYIPAGTISVLNKAMQLVGKRLQTLDLHDSFTIAILRHLTQLRTLRLSIKNLRTSPKTFDPLCTMPFCATLQELDLRNVQSMPVPMLLKLITNLTQLRRLHISNCRMLNLEFFESMIPACARLEHLSVPHLSNSEGTDQSGMRQLQAIATLPLLSSLTLFTRCALSNSAWPPLLKQARLLTTLKVISIIKNISFVWPLCDEELQGFHTLVQLKHLFIHDLHMDAVMRHLLNDNELDQSFSQHKIHTEHIHRLLCALPLLQTLQLNLPNVLRVSQDNLLQLKQEFFNTRLLLSKQ